LPIKIAVKNLGIFDHGLNDPDQRKIHWFVDLCRSHKVDKIYAFGSSITDHFDPEASDIDIVVTIDSDDPADRGESLLSTNSKFFLKERSIY
jgi:predicted nucleotidyltransferase